MKSSWIESAAYYGVKIFGAFVRLLPVEAALALGRFLGLIAYYADAKHRDIVFFNLKLAFARSKSPSEIKKIAKTLFQNYAQNVIELLRLPLMTQDLFSKYVVIEGEEHFREAVKQGKGVILLAMHFGSWELGSLSAAMMGQPYKMLVKPQKRFSRLDELLNSFRQCNGSVVIQRGTGTREFIKSLQNKETIGMVVDQGGKDGILVPFFGRTASMSVGAIRVGLKMGVPICFAVIMRKKGPGHRLIIHEPLKMQTDGDLEENVRANLQSVIALMERYITEAPSEYMWFYKIWKYSKEASVVVLHDGKVGHLRQSQTLASLLGKALAERDISSTVHEVEVAFRSRWAARACSVLSVFASRAVSQRRLEILQKLLTPESFRQVTSVKADFIISCGSSTAGLNYVLSVDQQAKNIAVLRPGLLSFDRFDLVVLPEHDRKSFHTKHAKLVYTKGAPNLISKEYLEGQKEGLLSRFSHLKTLSNLTIGLLLGGDTKDFLFNEQKVRMVVHQLKQVAEELKADILVTTSRRTSEKVEGMIYRELKKHPRCRLLIMANQNNVPEAMGGILALSDIVVVSGDSISMISEAASSGKMVVVFPIEDHLSLGGKKHKHDRFIERLNSEGYVLSAEARSVRDAIYQLAKNKLQTRPLGDDMVLLDAVREIA